MTDQEQERPVDDEAPEREPVDSVGERPEADVLEQSAVVRAEQSGQNVTVTVPSVLDHEVVAVDV